MRLEEHGLVLALEELAASASSRYRITCRFVCEETAVNVDSEVELHLYYIVQEALLNAVNHGKATMVIVTLAAEGGRLKLTVQDNGTGFQLADQRRSGMGIRIMRYRAKVIGATLDLQSQVNHGTQITCALNLSSARTSASDKKWLKPFIKKLPTGPNRKTSTGTAADKRRVFIVDDHTMFREGLRQLIERDPGLTVCGDAPDATEALIGIRASNPDVVIVDISLAGASGLDLIKDIKAEFEDLPVLVVSMHDESLYAERALRAGAMGYVMKHEPAKTVKAAIHKVLGGDLYLSEKMASSVVKRFMRGQSQQLNSPFERLSDRELEVFRMLGQGKSVRQIAEDLSVSIPTVNSFRNRIKEKLGLKTSTEVMLHAAQWFREDSPK